MLKNKTVGGHLAFFAAAAAAVSSVVYLIIYQATAAETVDRVFSWFTFGFMLAGGVTGIAGELLRWGWMPLVSCGCMSVALANHVVEFAYPLADVLTKVPFFGRQLSPCTDLYRHFWRSCGGIRDCCLYEA